VLSVILAGGVWAFQRVWKFPIVAPGISAQTSDNLPTYAEAQQAAQMMKMAGPLADYMAKQEPSSGPADWRQVEAVTWTPTPSDHVGGSVVGGTIPILHKTFGVRSAVQLAFEVPAHAASPRLLGSYHSSVQASGDGNAAIELLIMNEQQYTAFLHRRTGDCTFSAEEAPAGEVKVSLPPTMNQAARYHLVFCNHSHGGGRKFVKADFRMEF
jgi:hypothetical protein